MTVQQLIDKLSQQDPDAQVFIPGYEGGLDDIGEMCHGMVCRNYYREWYYGKHEELSRTDKSPADLSAYTTVKGIILIKGQ